MLENLSLPGVNRLLRANPWALERLQAHAGQTALLVCAPFNLRLTVLDSGEFAPAPAEAAPDVTIRATPGLMLRLAAGDAAAAGAFEVTGDVHFAATLDYLRRNLRWDYEEDLSHVFGDTVAHRMAGAARELERWGRSAVLNVSRAASEYWTYERPLIASAEGLDDYTREVDRLRDDVDRLEKRLQLLERRSEPPTTPRL